MGNLPLPISRRGFLLGTASGLAAGIAGTTLGTRAGWRILHAPHFTGQSVEAPRPEYAMPGRYPGRVVEVRDPAAVTDDNTIIASVVDRMVDRGMGELTGTDPGDVRAAWGTFFSKDDVIGLKVNPVGQAPKPGDGRVANAVGSISSFPLVVKIVNCLRELGVPARNIILFERYADMFAAAGYADLIERELPKGVRWYGSSVIYTNEQLAIDGFDQVRERFSPELCRHVAGYDPDVFTVMGYCMPEHSLRDDRRYRSHLSAVVTRLCNKIINIPVLKDHRSAGVTVCLKNLSHGMNNNVARSHIPTVVHGFTGQSRGEIGPNQCNTFIPQAASHHVLRQKATLHICDGLIGVYEGGPGCWNPTWGTWRHKGLFFGTDPVAMDHVGWDIIDTQRALQHLPPAGRTGIFDVTPATHVHNSLATLAAQHPLEALALAGASRNVQAGIASEPCNLRTPEHIILAGKLGLGRFDANEIQHTVVAVG
jgi:hypothetical protein